MDGFGSGQPMTDRARSWTDPYLDAFCPVPPAAPGVCQICHSGPGLGYKVCLSCSQTTRQVSRCTRLVLPISLYRLPSQLHTFLRQYKNAPGSTAATVMAAALGLFAAIHQECITRYLGGPVDVVTTVPSTRGRPGVHPLVSLVRRSRVLGPLHHELLTDGPAAATHNRADDRAFAVLSAPENQRVLVVDDTFTSGARAQSAAAALYLAGARRVVVLVIGRVIDPEYNDNCHAIWREMSAHAFNFDTCCWCLPGR
jgi:predicted amidophosphoribosyltransferase